MESRQHALDSEAAEDALGRAFVEALASRDPNRLRATLHSEVELRALVPSGFKESLGAEAVLARMGSWFAEPKSLTVASVKVYHVSDRLRIQYRFQERYSDGETEIIEQDAYVEVDEGRIRAIDLLCSGHLPQALVAPSEVRHYDAGDLGCGSGLAQEFRRQMSAIPLGSTLEVAARDPAAKEDLPALARMLGHQVLSVAALGDGGTIVTVKRGR